MKAIAFIKKNSMLLLAGAAIIGFSSFKIMESNSTKLQSSVIFRYTPPSGVNPYSAANVQNTANWQKEDVEVCSELELQDVACSILVPLGNTMNGGNNIDPSKVTIETSFHSTNNYGVAASTSATPKYTNPINKPLQP